MTLRSVFLGLALGAIICGVTFFNDMVLRGTFLVGNYLPISVFGGLLILTMVINPLLRRRWAFSGKELAVVVALALVACSVPGRGLMHYFTNLLMLPHERARTHASWKAQALLSVVPRQMLADPASEKEISDYVTGLRDGTQPIHFDQIPWRVWTRALWFWIPLLLSLWLGTMALAVVLHRQWAHHERLRYPIVTFAHALLPDATGRVGGVFRRPAFWIVAGLVIAMHVNNYASLYYPETMVRIPMRLGLGPLAAVWDTYAKSWFGPWALDVDIYLVAVGFAYFLSSDLSLSLGLAPHVWAVVHGAFLMRGTDIFGSFFSDEASGPLRGGAFFGLFVVLMYYGRRYFSAVFSRAVLPLFPARREVSPTAVWAARTFVVAMACFVLQLIFAGVAWDLAILYSIGAVIIYTVISRIVCETGAFFIHAYHMPGVILLGFLGLGAIDVRSLTIMFLVSSLTFIDPREAVMPFLATGLRLVELTRGSIRRTWGWASVALVMAFAVALPVTLYIQYDQGAKNVGDFWTLGAVPRMALDNISVYRNRIRQDPDLAVADIPRGPTRFGRAQPSQKAVIAFGFGLGLVLVFSTGRLRYPWWPIHPILFAVWGTYQNTMLGMSFLIGWAIKVVVARLFGGRGYERLKPVMIGLIAGDVLGGIIPMIHGAVYYLITDVRPIAFRVLPH